MGSTLITNTKGGCGVTFLAYLLAYYFNLHCVSNSDPLMDFKSLDVFSSSSNKIPETMLFQQNTVYDLKGPLEQLKLLMADASSMVSNCIIPTATDAISINHTIQVARLAQQFNIPVSVVINNYRTEKALTLAQTVLSDQLPQTSLYELRSTTLFGRLSFDGRDWLEKVHHTKGEGRLLQTLKLINEKFDSILLNKGEQHVQ